MNRIKSFTEAKHKLDELRQGLTELSVFLAFADEAISKVNSLKGSDDGAGAFQLAGPPATWGERVIEIFRQAENKPLMQKEAMKRYERTGWPKPTDPAAFYRAISGAFAYLHKKKGVLEKTDAGYRLKN